MIIEGKKETILEKVTSYLVFKNREGYCADENQKQRSWKSVD